MTDRKAELRLVVGAPPPSDTDLARQAAGGSEDAFADLVRRHQAGVRGLARRLAGNAAGGDDIAQAAFLTAWRKIGTWSGGSVKSWLMTIAYREFLQAKRKMRPEVAFDEGAHVVAFDRSASRYDAHIDLADALKALPETQRICVSLCVAAGLSHAEAARATGWPLGTVKSHITRGVAALRQMLAGEDVA